MARTYHVLKRIEGEKYNFEYLADIEASNPEQAIRLTAVDQGTGRYVAVPDGNWTSIGVRVEIPAPRVIFENEPQTAEEESGAAKLAEMILPPEEPLADDPEFQERKAELAARRAGQ